MVGPTSCDDQKGSHGQSTSRAYARMQRPKKFILLYTKMPSLDAHNGLRSILLLNVYGVLRCALTVGHSGASKGHCYGGIKDAYHTHRAQLSHADQPGGRPWLPSLSNMK